MSRTAAEADAGRRHPRWPACGLCPRFAIDIGSARTRAWTPGRGVVLDVPTVTFPGTGGIHPVQRGAIVDTAGVARMLDRLLGRRTAGPGRPLIVLSTPVLGGPGFRGAALEALEVLRPRTVLTVPAARAIALGAAADMSRPLVVVDLGAQVTEVALLADGAVADAYRTALGTTDLDDAMPVADVAGAVVAMVADMLRADRTPQSLLALRRGVVLAGGGALRPEIAYALTDRLRVPVRPATAPHTAALRGAGQILAAVHRHPASAVRPGRACDG
ncbi:rod shape-determining protein [Streptomyces zhihengii]|uniref:rod shape-determining protein n=1 Tax=Streptomyces zhihengii TaxID=1818004 RepID=UPI003630F9ED